MSSFPLPKRQKAEPMKRFSIELPSRSLDRLKRLKEETEASSYIEVIRRALIVYEATLTKES